MATKQGMLDIVKELLKGGADVSKKDTVEYGACFHLFSKFIDFDVCYRVD